MKTSGWIVIGLLAVVGVVLAGAGFVSAQTAADADFDGSGDVGFQDFLLFAAKFNTSEGDGEYEAKFDIDGNGSVGFTDFLTFARFFGETVPLPTLALTGIAPAEGMPGTLIELLGQFDANTTYKVRFGTVSLPVDVQDTTRITAMAPVLPAGSVQVRVVDASGRETEPTSFEVLALAEPRMNAEQLRQTVAEVGKGIGNAFLPLSGVEEIFSNEEAASLSREMGRLNAAWGVIGERIAALPPEEAALLSHLLDNSGALGILEGLGKIDLSASKVAAENGVIAHHVLYQLDLVSFYLGNVASILEVVTIVGAIAAVTGVGALVSGLGAATSVALSLAQITINSVVPTDLKEVKVEIMQTPVPAKGRSDVAFYGVFSTENESGESALVGLTLNEAIGKLLERYIRSDALTDEAMDTIEEFVSGIYLQVGLDATDQFMPDWLSKLGSERNIRLDMSVYRIGLLDAIVRFVPGIGKGIGKLLQKFPIDLTFHEPVKVENTDVAKYNNRTDQLEGIEPGETRLMVRAYRFDEYEITVPIPFSGRTITLASIWKPAGVETQEPFEVTRSFNFQGIAGDNKNGELYALHAAEPGGGSVWEARKDRNGLRAYDEIFNLLSVAHATDDRAKKRRVYLPLGIAYASTGPNNKILYVVGHEAVQVEDREEWKLHPRLFKYMRFWEDQDFGEWKQYRIYDLAEENVAPLGVAFDGAYIYVADEEADKVYVYNESGATLNLQRDRSFDLGEDNGFPQGITYADGRMFVVDAEDDSIYAYARAGDSWARDASTYFDLDRWNKHPGGITYANGRLHVVDSENGNIYEYGPNLVVESLAVSDSTLTHGRKFTLHTVIRNRGIADAPRGTLMYDGPFLASSDTTDVDGLKPLESSAYEFDVGRPLYDTYDTSIRRVTYRACVWYDVVNDGFRTFRGNCSKNKVAVRFVYGGRPGPTNVAVYRLDSDNGLPTGVTSVDSFFYVVDADSTVYAYDAGWNRTSTSDFELTAANGRPTGIAYADDRFYVVDRGDKVYVYDGSGTSTSTGFNLGMSRNPPGGMVYADGRFHVVHSDRGSFFHDLENWEPRVSTLEHDSGQFRKLSDEILLVERASSPVGIGYPAGIAYADSLFFVVDSEYEKVYVYDASWKHKPALDFVLHSSNADPSGITYANNRFFVVDARDSLVYRYPKAKLPPDLTVESLAVSDSVLAPGVTFTLSATVKNVGNEASNATTLLYYVADDSSRIGSHTLLDSAAVDAIAAQDTSHASLTLTAPSKAGTVYYAACIRPVEREFIKGNNCLKGVRVTVRDSGPVAGGPLVVESMRRLTNSVADEREPTWSPDGGHIAFESNRRRDQIDIWVMGSDGSNPRNLTSQPGTDDTGDSYSPAWSPDGRHIAFVYSAVGQDIYAVGLDGRFPRRIYFGIIGPRYLNPEWSPDGRHIVFYKIGTWETGWEKTIYVVGSDGSDPQKLGSGVEPMWSPDGRHIAFSNRDDNHDIWVMGSDGSNPRNLTKNDGGRNPQWSPDGRHIAFVSYRDGNDEIYVMGSDGSNPRNLTKNNADDDNPVWSPDGRHIAFVSYRDGDNEIYVMGSDGSNPRNLTKNNADDDNPVWSPDGRHIAFISYRDGNREIYVIAFQRDEEGSGQ